MTEPARLLLLGLGLLVARQRALAAGQAEPVLLAALREPLCFEFVPEAGERRCVFPDALREAFGQSILVCARADFVAPLASLVPHVKLARQDDGTWAAQLSAALNERLGNAAGATVQAYYSPLQVLFTPRVGYFLPPRGAWHRFVGAAIAARVDAARLQPEGAGTAVTWPLGRVHAADGAAGPCLEFEAPDLAFRLEVTGSGFELRVRPDGGSALAAGLQAFCAAPLKPLGIAARVEPTGELRIASEAAPC